MLARKFHCMVATCAVAILLFAESQGFAQRKREPQNDPGVEITANEIIYTGKFISAKGNAIKIKTRGGKEQTIVVNSQTKMNLAGDGDDSWIVAKNLVCVSGTLVSDKPKAMRISDVILEVFPYGYNDDDFTTTAGRVGEQLKPVFRGTISSASPLLVAANPKANCQVFPQGSGDVALARHVDQLQLSGKAITIELSDSERRVWVNLGRSITNAPANSSIQVVVNRRQNSTTEVRLRWEGKVKAEDFTGKKVKERSSGRPKKDPPEKSPDRDTKPKEKRSGDKRKN